MEYTEEMMNMLSRMRLHLEGSLEASIATDNLVLMRSPSIPLKQFYFYQELFHDRAQHFGIIGGHH